MSLNDIIYKRIIEELFKEASTMAGGAVSFSVGPLGASPDAINSKKDIYKSQKATDKKHRSKKKKSKNKSVQYYLGLNKPKTLKEVYKVLTEAARTPQLEDLSKEALLAVLNYMIGNISEDYNIDITEKFAGQHMSVLVKGTNKGNRVYCAVKDSYSDVKDSLVKKGIDPTQADIMVRDRFYNSKGTSHKVKTSFIKKYKRLQPGETKYFGIEVLKPDRRKPDFISYGLKHQIAQVYLGDMTSEEAKRLSSYRHRIEFRTVSDATRTPIDRDKLASETVKTIEDLIQKVENQPKYTKKFVKDHIKPTIKSILISVFGYSLIGTNSPFEGVFIRLKGENENVDFKIPYQGFSETQSISTSLYNHFTRGYNKSTKYITYDRINNFVNDLITMQNDSGELKKGTTAYIILKYAAKLPQLNIDSNIRVFFSPYSFEAFCKLIVDVYINKNTNKISNLIKMLEDSIRNYSEWHSNNAEDSYHNAYTPQIINLFNELENNL
jgi:hypothetical protein